jgi:O-antigen ligase
MAVVARRSAGNAVRIGQRALLKLRAQWAAFLVAAVTPAAFSAIGASEGGFFPKEWRLSLFALAALMAAALVGRERLASSRREWLAVAALAGFTAWIAASRYWTDSPPTFPEWERSLLYVAGLATVLVCVGWSSLPHLLCGALAGVTAVCAYGLGEYVLSPPPLHPFEGTLLYEPIGYANALGIYAVLGIVLAVGLALWARSRLGRAAALAPIAVLVPTLYFTSSRGAWVVLPVGIVTTLYLSRRVRSLVLLSLLAGGVVTSFVLSYLEGQPLSLFGPNRPHYWRVAWNDFEEHPLLGSGAGTFFDYWLRHRPIQEFPHDAHSLYIESLAELGPLGLLLVVVALGIPLLALRGRQEPLVAAAAGGYVAFLVHAGVDWDWEMPAVTLAGLVCAGAVLVGTRPGRAEISPRARAALLVGAVLLAVLAVARLATTGGLHP